ncbi:hypothetical protein F2Q68_00001493 [Brassica cretica]|uniref:Uncharacterized protein n=1 Tax=Brassica cretica TaxID=69181 RepID=A0A8S9J448_BRACR|nr:hypothetical protein F2Q68_00001493 [Brassica cretica]
MGLTFMNFFTTAAITGNLRESPIQRRRREDRHNRRPWWVWICLLTEKTDIDAVRTETVVVRGGFDRSSDGADGRS